MINGHKIIALCTCRVHNEVGYKLISEFNRCFVKKGYRLFVYGTCSDLFWDSTSERGEIAVFDLIDYSVVDVLIVHEESIKNKETVRNIIKKANASNVPVITIGNSIEGSIGISFDYEAGIEQIVRHLIEEHHLTKLHFMSGLKGNPFSVTRQAAFQKVLEEKGIPFSEDMISYGDFWSEPTEQATIKLIKSDNVPQAIVCANDTMAMTVCNVLNKFGYSIPEDVVVTGFDGSKEVSFCSPQITSCFCSHRDLGEKLLEILEDYFQGKERKQTYSVLPRISIAESCGCNKHLEIDVSGHLVELNDRVYNMQEGNRIFTEIASKAQTCSNIAEVAENYDCGMMGDMCCMINQGCVDECVNPLFFDGKSFSDTMCLLFDLDDERCFVPRKFVSKDIAPDMEKLLSRGMPLIFVALNFLHIPLGYVCFHFRRFQIGDYNKITQVINSLNNAVGGFRNMQYQNFLKKQIEEMYQQDALTGLYNRNRFMREYEKLIKRLEKEEKQISIMLADLDGLKYINDNFGHGEGDLAIHTVAQALKYAAPEGSICARFGGDELIGVCMGTADPVAINLRLEEYLEKYNAASDKPYRVAASLGVYVANSSENLSFEALLKKTDQLMYVNKAKRKQEAVAKEE